MKITPKWGNKNQKPKSKKSSLPLHGKAVKISTFQKEPGSCSIEEIRDQAQILSSRELGQGPRSHPYEDEPKRGTVLPPVRGGRHASPRVDESNKSR